MHYEYLYEKIFKSFKTSVPNSGYFIFYINLNYYDF